MKTIKGKLYGSIPHMPGSCNYQERDVYIDDTSYRIAIGEIKPKNSKEYPNVYVTEKMDGSCCGVILTEDNQVVALTRAGNTAWSSPYYQHHVFAQWVLENEDQFRKMMFPGQRIVGEWVLQLHSTMYREAGFYLFDVFDSDNTKCCYEVVKSVVEHQYMALLKLPRLVAKSEGKGSKLSPNNCFYLAQRESAYSPEGLVYTVEAASTVEHGGKVLFKCKWVRPGYEPGKYMKDEVWQPFSNVHEFSDSLLKMLSKH